MKILALERERPGTQASDFTPHLKAEAVCVWHLYQNGAVRELYFRQERSEVV